jgi:chemotaxis protein MotB
MRIQKRRKSDNEVDESSGGAPSWMVTYGDLMSLLLTFFVLLVSFSSIQMVEFEKAMGSLKGALGVLKYKKSVTQSTKYNIPQLSGFKLKETEDKIEEIKEFIANKGIAEQVQLSVTEDGIAIRMLETIMFDLGKAELKSTAHPILNKIAELIRSWPNRVRIEGHTDDLPIKTAEFPSNWELSAVRAINVIHYFKDIVGIDGKKLVCQGHGENNPVAANDSDQNRAKNRRVEIFLEPGNIDHKNINSASN